MTLSDKGPPPSRQARLACGRHAAHRATVAATSVVVAGLLLIMHRRRPLSRGIVSCRGSFGDNGNYRRDEKGTLRYFAARNTSCPAGRTLVRAFLKVSVLGPPTRGETIP